AIASGGGERFCGDEADIRIFAANRLVYRDSRSGGIDSAATANRAGAVSTRQIRGGVNGADGASAFLLRTGSAGICGDQVDYADVLLDARHDDAGEGGGLCAGAEHPVQLDLPAFLSEVFFEWKSGAGEFAFGVFQFYSVVCGVPQATRAAGSAGTGSIHRQNGGMRGGDGDGLLCGVEDA